MKCLGQPEITRAPWTEGSQSRYFQDTKRPGSRACSGPVETNPLPVESGITEDDDSVQFVSLMQSGQGRLEQQKVQEKIEMEEQTECPLCGKSFPVSKIEQHASSCGEEQEEDPLPQVATTTPWIVSYGAKERHIEKCIQQMTRHQHAILMGIDVVTGTRGRATRASAETAGSSMSKQQGLFGAYKSQRLETHPEGKQRLHSRSPQTHTTLKMCPAMIPMETPPLP